jgi:N-acetylmuramoyl-L-alanine amidase
VRKPFFFFLVFCAAIAAAIYASQLPSEAKAQTAPSQPTTAPPAATPTAPVLQQSQSLPPAPVLTIVVDAAHGGADNGAHGSNGINEKDVVLALARGVRAELTRQGYRVVMTRDNDADPTFDDRAAIANQFAEAIYVTLHVASTGTPSTARVYYYRVAQPFTFAMPDTSAAAGGAVIPTLQAATPPASGGLIPWRQAQNSFADSSHRLADLVQSGLTQKFSNSPATSESAAVRDLRSVAAPAIAIEVSNISSPNVSMLEAMSPAIAAAIGHSVAVFQPAGILNGTASGGGMIH